MGRCYIKAYYSFQPNTEQFSMFLIKKIKQGLNRVVYGNWTCLIPSLEKYSGCMNYFET